ncbi:MAG: dephospho-CoA kinase [Nitrospira sp.]|nr:dephospho-CoA kinase [Candidatus Manganitrophaceae bacterium]HIL34155.1 dephospho-CoA kinase [Candidatus Manganitrophaceae bacterium]
MIWVGLTGGIASGKSTVSRFLRQSGAFIVDADEIAHDLIKKGNKAYQPVIDAFGREILDSSGEINRSKLGKIIFQDATRRQMLNQIVHPGVFESALSEREVISQKYPKAVIIFDAALLIETDAYKEMDWLLLVYVDRMTQIDRLTRREGLTRSEATLRIDTQMPLDQKLPFADEVICNQEKVPKVKEAVNRIYLRLRDRAAEEFV